MSLRQIRRLQGTDPQPTEKIAEQDNDEENEEVEEEKPKVQKLKNAFEMFQMDDNDDDDDDEDEPKEKTKKKNGKEGGASTKEEKEEAEDDQKGGDQAKKKKKKKKAKKTQNTDQEEKKETDPQEEEKEDEFDKALKEFQEETKETENNESCLRINIKALDYNKELAKFFKNAKLTNKKQTDKNSRDQRIMNHLRHNRNTKNFKNYKLVYTDTTNMFNPERFACEIVKHNEYKMKVFAFQPTKKYEDLQEAYENLRNTHDPNNLMQFLQQNPTHADALFDVAELLRTQGDYKQTNQLLESLLFVYEDSFSYDFNIFDEDDVMLAFDENKYSSAFFASLNRFMDVLGKKGCYKSALEYNKFLVKLNPYQDPVGGLLTIDYNALSSQNYDFLISFPHKFGKQYYRSDEYSLIYLPNYTYSCALAKFMKVVEDENIGMSQYAAITIEDFKTAAQTKIDPCQENANVMLLHAILLFPSIIKEIIEVDEYAKQSVALGGDIFTNWQKKSYKDILAHKVWEQGKREYIYPCMNANNSADIEGISKVAEIYVERSKILWKNNKVILWVKACIGLILNQIEGGFNYEEYMEGLFTAEFKYKIPFEFSRYKGLHKSNFSDRVVRIDFNNIQDNQRQNRQQRNYNPINPNSGIMNLLFGSLLPWNHIARNDNQNREHDPDDVEIEEEEF